jgi:hypothetical protein
MGEKAAEDAPHHRWNENQTAGRAFLRSAAFLDNLLRPGPRNEITPTFSLLSFILFFFSFSHFHLILFDLTFLFFLFFFFVCVIYWFFKRARI